MTFVTVGVKWVGDGPGGRRRWAVMDDKEFIVSSQRSRSIVTILSIIAPLAVVATVALAGRGAVDVAPDFSAGPSLQARIAAYVGPVREARALQFAKRPLTPHEVREVAWLWVLRTRRGELTDIHQHDVRWQNPGAALNQIQRSRDWIADSMRRLADKETRDGNLVQAALDLALAKELPTIALVGESPLPEWAKASPPERP